MKILTKLLLNSLFLLFSCNVFAMQGECMNNVFFNCIYTIIGDETYQEIKKSDFLKNKFCHCEEKTHYAEGGMTWTGIFLSGENNYIEIFNYKDREELLKIQSGGNYGIAFSVDTKKEFEGIVEKIKEKISSNNCKEDLIIKLIDGKSVNWFNYLMFTDNCSTMPELDSWFMAYHKDYPKSVGKSKPENEGVITRKYYNKECGAVPYDESKLFKDIEEITLWLSDENKEKFIEQLTLFGYKCEDINGSIICLGPDVAINLKPSNDTEGKHLILRMSLNREVDKSQTHEFGKSKLELEDMTALWTFWE